MCIRESSECRTSNRIESSGTDLSSERSRVYDHWQSTHTSEDASM